MKLFETIQNDMIEHLLEICQEVLDLDSIPPYELIMDKSYIEGGGKKSFGEFDGEIIRVVSKDRHPMDVMRTFAHELTHWKQSLTGEYMNGKDGSNVENEANAAAGFIMRKFGERYPDYFINSLPSH